MPKDWSGIQLQVGKVYVYSLTMMLGMLCAILTVWYFWRREKYDLKQLSILIFIALPTAMIGARTFFIIQQAIDKNWDTVKRFWAILEGGLSIHGGVIFATFSVIMYLRFSKEGRKISFRKAFSIILPAVLIGQAIGRWGNFANHEIYGGIMSVDSFAFKILTPTIRNHMFIGGHYRLPLFLYEFSANLIAYIIIVWVLNFYNWLRPGTTGGIYILYYGIIRVGMEPLRDGSYTIYKVIASLYIIGGLTLIILFEFIIKLNFNVFRIPLSKNEKLGKIFYFIVYEDKIKNIDVSIEENDQPKKESWIKRLKLKKKTNNNESSLGVTS